MSYALQHLIDRSRRRSAEVRPRIASVTTGRLGAVTIALDHAPLSRGVRPERWRIQSRGHCHFRFVSPDAFPIAVAQRHPVLRARSEPWDVLEFSGKPRWPAQCVAAIHLAHVRWAEGSLPFDFFFDPRIALERLLSGGSGTLVSAPRSYVWALQSELRPFELTLTSRPDPARPGDPGMRGTVLLLGSNHFAAPGFGAEPCDLP